jgi:hypothetical protein
MASSAVEVCNLALVSLGANTINDLTEDSTEAKVCNVFWDTTRRKTLRSHPWNFAIRRVELARELATPTYGYQYQYVLPADCLKVHDVNENRDFRIENRRIVTNESTCFIRYVADVEDVSVWDDAFVDVVAAHLRYDLAYTITTSNTSVNAAWEYYQEKLRIAKAIDAAEDYQDDLARGDSALIAVRS